MPSVEFSVGPLDLSERGQLDEAATLAVRAFQFDPFFVWLCSRPLLRARGLGVFFRSQLAGFAALGERTEAYAARRGDGQLLGVAVWLRPGSWPLPVRTQLRQGLGAFWALWPVPSALVHGTRYLLAIEKSHPREPLWYLYLMASDPSAQRVGIGTALHQKMLEQADADGLPSYLETQKQENVVYYRRFGYEVVTELSPAPSGPSLWTMRREPRPKS
jgi:ribosomal protein S18 acetylase RimI-like enzyme